MRGGYPFWALTAAFLLAATAIAGTANHVVPLLTDAGMSSKMATLAFSTGGLALILGRISSGILAEEDVRSDCHNRLLTHTNGGHPPARLRPWRYPTVRGGISDRHRCRR